MFAIFYATRQLNQYKAERVRFYEEKGDVGDQIGGWFMSPSDPSQPDSPTNLDGLASHFAKSFYGTLKAAGAGVASGEARRLASVDEKMMGAIIEDSPQLRLITKALERLGLDDLINPQDLPYIVEKYGGNLVGLGPSSGKHSIKKSWE